MKRFTLIGNWVIVLCLFLAPKLQAAEGTIELQQQVRQLMNQVKTLEHKVHQLLDEQRKLKEKMFAGKSGVPPREETETEYVVADKTSNDAKTGETHTSEKKLRDLAEDTSGGRNEQSLVDLSPQEWSSIEGNDSLHILAKPWWKNFEIHGFGAAGFYDTGSAGTRADGGFAIKEASLFIEADVWEDIAFFLELQTNRLGKDDDLFTRTGEVYIHFREVSVSETMPFGIKLGRFDIPFGEEYLWQDAIDNPLITNSAAYPYGWDEGILLYSSFNGLNWIVAVTDGTETRSLDTNLDKAVNLKFYGKPSEALYLSASLMRNGDTEKSGIEFGGSHFQPVGDSGNSTVGRSPSNEVDAFLAEFDAKYSFDSAPYPGYFALSLGAAKQDDDDSSFDRNIYWFSVEPYLSFNPKWYTVLRYSEIGTYNNDEGYHFDGKIFAGGNDAFGFDAKRLRRLALGLGWIPNPHIRAKLEIGADWFDLIDASPLSAKNDNRKFIGFEIAVGF